jgi:hypothetical protein
VTTEPKSGAELKETTVSPADTEQAHPFDEPVTAKEAAAGSNRRLLLRAHERLSQSARMWNGCIEHDPTGQILSAWIAKEELRALCATAAHGGHRAEIRQPAGCVLPLVCRRRHPRAEHPGRDDRDMVAIEVFLTTGLTNARTEGTNRLSLSQ